MIIGCNYCFQTHDAMITDLRADFERQAKEIESKYEKKMRALRDELDLRRKTEIHEIEVCDEFILAVQLPSINSFAFELLRLYVEYNSASHRYEFLLSGEEEWSNQHSNEEP